MPIKHFLQFYSFGFLVAPTDIFTQYLGILLIWSKSQLFDGQELMLWFLISPSTDHPALMAMLMISPIIGCFFSPDRTVPTINSEQSSPFFQPDNGPGEKG